MHYKHGFPLLIPGAEILLSSIKQYLSNAFVIYSPIILDNWIFCLFVCLCFKLAGQHSINFKGISLTFIFLIPMIYSVMD